MEHFFVGQDPRQRAFLDDARQVVRQRFALHFDGARPSSQSQTLVPVAGLAHLARAYAVASRERRAYLLIAPVSSLLLGINQCGELKPAFQAGMADYLALTALFHAEPAYWPPMWEAQTSGAPARMVAELAHFVAGVRSVAARCFVRSGPARLRNAVNTYLQSERGFMAVDECFGRGGAPHGARLLEMLRSGSVFDGTQPSGKRA